MEKNLKSCEELLKEIERLNGDIITLEKRESHHRLIEKDLLLRNALFEQLFSNISHGIAILDPNDDIVNINKAFEKMFNYSLPEVIGKQLNDVLVPKELHSESTELSNITFDGRIADKETIRKRKDGSLINVRILGVPIIIEGQIRSIFAIYEDITDRINNEKSKLHEAELRTQAAELHARITESQVFAAEAHAKAIQAENLRKTNELEEARKIQISMLPRELPPVNNMEIAVYMKTAREVGGDYYDFLIAEDGTLIIAIGDATGHGLKAGTMVTIIKSLFYADAARMNITPFFEKCTSTIKKIQLSNLYMGLTIARIKNHELLVSAAGMPPIYHYKAATHELEKVLFKSMPLGAFSNYNYIERNINLEKNDSLFFLTDGLPELFNDRNEILDYEPIEEIFLNSAAEKPQVIIDKLVKIGEEWNKEKNQNDDITFIVIKIKE